MEEAKNVAAMTEENKEAENKVESKENVTDSDTKNTDKSRKER